MRYIVKAHGYRTICDSKTGRSFLFSEDDAQSAYDVVRCALEHTKDCTVRKVPAIRAVRSLTGLGLGESKLLVEYTVEALGGNYA